MSIRERLARTPPGYRYSIGRILAIYSGLMVTLLLAALDQTILATALPQHRRRPRRADAVLVGLHGVPARDDGDRADLREARRRLRAPAAVHHRDLHLPLGSALCGARAGHDAARRLPRGPGSRRRRLDPARARGDREHRPAARPRPLPGTDRRRVRRRVDHRPCGRRLHRRQHELALDLLRQPARRRGRADRHLDHDAAPARRHPALDRLDRRVRARAGNDRAPARARLGRAPVRVGLRPRS